MAAARTSVLLEHVRHLHHDQLGVVGDGGVPSRVRQVVVTADQQLAGCDRMDGFGSSTSGWATAPASRSTAGSRHHPAIKVIMLTMSEDHDTALTALRDGASG
jgi:hypothetical protein